jgi:type IV pilus assembly protein PilF
MHSKLRRVAAAAAVSALVALVGACASTLEHSACAAAAPEPLPPIKAPEVSPKDRAALTPTSPRATTSAGGMDVAIEELTEAATLDPPIRGSTIFSASSTRCSARNAKAEQNFQRALALAPDDSDLRHNWGWYLCSNERPRESIPQFELALRNPFYKTPEVALTNAGRCSAAFGDIAGAEAFYQRALARSPANAPALYGLALLAFKGGRLDEARGYTRRLRNFPRPRRKRSISACASREKRATGPPRLSTIAQLRNRYPDSAEAKAVTSGALRVTPPQANAMAGEALPPGATAGALLVAAREASGLSIDAVAQQLKLAPRQVRALEEGDYDHLPGRTFVRGFLKSYARLLRLDPDEVLGALTTGTAASALDAPLLQATAPTMGELPTAEHSKAAWTRWAIPLILAAVVAAAAVYEWVRPIVAARTAVAPATAPETSHRRPPHPTRLARRCPIRCPPHADRAAIACHRACAASAPPPAAAAECGGRRGRGDRHQVPRLFVDRDPRPRRTGRPVRHEPRAAPRRTSSGTPPLDVVIGTPRMSASSIEAIRRSRPRTPAECRAAEAPLMAATITAVRGMNDVLPGGMRR